MKVMNGDRAWGMLIMKLVRCEPFAFARFNDGEMNAIIGRGPIARNTQRHSRELQVKLIEALDDVRKGFYKGAPCSACFTRQYTEFANRCRDDRLAVPATLFCNAGRWKPTIELFDQFFRYRRVLWVAGADQDLDNLGYTNPLYAIRVPDRDAFEKGRPAIQKLKRANEVPSGTLVILTCGPLGRVIAHRVWSHRQDLTLLDVGSLFDPITRGVTHSCHKGTLARCEVCNPV